MKAAVFCIIAALAFVTANDDYKIVNINQGPVKGYKVPDHDVFAFYGIPYATAPTGRDKFKAPLPPPNWTEPLEAVDIDIRCPQYGLDKEMYQEDCLVASVYVPDTNETNLPVVFFVHGGGFIFGFGNSNTPYQFVDYNKNVIFVTFNYRLGLHGFLCLGTLDAPGNSGMKDQVAALKWVHQNIASFGGNPNDITIAGCSAGGASVDLLMLSKSTKGLFNKVISLSGVHMAVFAIQEDPTLNARNYAKNIGHNGPDNIDAIADFYMNISFEHLVSHDLTQNKNHSFIFTPCVERDLGIEKFLHDTPTNIIRSDDYVSYPTLYGWADMEGKYRVPEFEDWKNYMNEDFAPFLPADLKFDSPAHKQEVAQQVKEFYFGNNPVSSDNILNYVDYISDTLFIIAIQRAVTMQVEAGNDHIYLFVFSHVYDSVIPIPYTNVKGADQPLRSISSNVRPKYFIVCRRFGNETDDERCMAKFHLHWPTPEKNTSTLIPKWEPAAADRTPCMEFGDTIGLIPGAYAEDRMAFWEDIYDRYYVEHVAPYDF